MTKRATGEQFLIVADHESVTKHVQLLVRPEGYKIIDFDSGYNNPSYERAFRVEQVVSDIEIKAVEGEIASM